MSEPATPLPALPFSVLTAGLKTRLGLALLLAAVVWATLFWAVA